MSELAWIVIAIGVAVAVFGVYRQSRKGAGGSAPPPDLGAPVPAPVKGLAASARIDPPAPPPRAAAVPTPAATRTTRHVFVCYRREESADITGRIYDALAGEFGREALFKDVDSILPGQDYRKVLETSVADCDVMLVVVGRSWLAAAPGAQKRRLDQPSDFVRMEIEAALRRDIPVIPVLVQGASMPDADLLPPKIQDFAFRQGVAVRTDPDFHHDKDRLVAAIRANLRSA